MLDVDLELPEAFNTDSENFFKLAPLKPSKQQMNHGRYDPLVKTFFHLWPSGACGYFPRIPHFDKR
jgi:hypothetical protein